MLVGAELVGNVARTKNRQPVGGERITDKMWGHTVWSVAGECIPPSLGHFGETDLDFDLSDGETALLRIDLAFEGF